MATKYTSASCASCESTFGVDFMEEMVSEDLPQYCPFCGEEIEDVVEEFGDEEFETLDPDSDFTEEW
jgi:NAD-dependent SIR2 family protein deacetylase